MSQKNMNQTHDNISELGPDTEIRQITKFVDDVNVESYEKPMMSSTLAWTRMAEDSKLHDIHAILQRPVNVLDGEFNSAFTNVNLKFPDIIFQRSSNVVSKLDYFTYFRANVKIKLVFNATPFMSGKYWMFFAPFDSVSNRGARLDALANNTGFPGVEIDLASSAPVEIKIPYCSPLSHYNLLDTHSNMGELFIVPINAVQTGASPVANGATFTLFAWFEDIELAMPTSRPITVPARRQELEWSAQIGGSEEHAATSGPSISGAANAVASTASMLGGALPTLGKWIRPVEWVSRAVGGAAEAVGWNKPTNLDKNCLYTNTPAKGYTNADGIDMSSKLCAMPDNGLTYDEGIFSTDVDEMDIKYVTSKSCIYESAIPWSTDSAVGTTLHYNSVAPGMATGPGPYDPTTLAFVTSMFRYWRGTIKYRLTVAKTAFHTGRLRITYHPGVYGENAITPGVVHENAYNWILDLSVSSELEFEIPYIANVPWKECYVGRSDDTLAWRQERYSTGTITITVLTQLRRASVSVANNCPLNMWISGGEDISFAIPDFGSYGIAAPTTTRRVREVEDPDDQEWTAQVFNLTSKGVEHNEQVTNTASEMFPMQHMSHTAAEELTMGEKITNLRQLIKRFGITSRGESFPYRSVKSRYCFPGPIPLNNDKYLYNQIELDPAYFGVADDETAIKPQYETYPISRNPDGTLIEANDFVVANRYPTRCPLYYVSYLYRFFRGGRRYKIANPGNGIVKSAIAASKPVRDGTTEPTFTNIIGQFDVTPQRTFTPMIALRESLVKENGTIDGPVVGRFTSTEVAPVFEHYIYPDLTGTIEFEVPYYAQTPVSLVGEGTIVDDEGPLIRRSLVKVRRSENPRGLDQPMYSGTSTSAFMVSPGVSAPDSGGIRGAFGAYTLYEAAADDFSFGYLIGAPRIRRVPGA